MHLSWEIQKHKPDTLEQKQKRGDNQRSIRSIALETAWTILQTEEITVCHLVRRYSHEKYPNKTDVRTLGLFQ